MALSGRAPSARGWSWTCARRCLVGLIGDASASCGREIIISFYVQREVFAKFACKLLDRGADTSRGTPCETLKSTFKWAEEAHGDDELLSMLGASGSRSRSAECERATTGAARYGRPLGQDGRLQGLPEKRPPSSSVPVLAIQRRKICAQAGVSFSDFGADDQGRSVAVALAALSTWS